MASSKISAFSASIATNSDELEDAGGQVEVGRKIPTPIFPRTDDSLLDTPLFKKMLKRFLKYVKKHKSPNIFESRDAELYKWQQGLLQRLSKERKELSDEEKKAREQLLVLGFPFSWDFLSKMEKQVVQQRENWEEMFRRLMDYQRKYKTLKVSEREDLELHRWVTSQRSNLSDASNVKTFAMIERRRRLQSIGFQWHSGGKCAEVEDSPLNISGLKRKEVAFGSRTSWEDRYAELKSLPDVNNVTQKESPDLYRWISKQRSYYSERKKGGKNSLSDERISLLELIGFSWTAKKAKSRKSTKNAGVKVKVEPNISSFFSPRGVSRQEVLIIDMSIDSDEQEDFPDHNVSISELPQSLNKRHKSCQDIPVAEEASSSNFCPCTAKSSFTEEQSDGHIDESFFDIIANLARLTASEVSAVREFGVEDKEDLALLSEDAISSILCSTTSSMKVTRLHQLGRFIAKQGKLTKSTTMKDVVLFLG